MNRRNFLCKFVGAIVAASEICRLELPKAIPVKNWIASKRSHFSLVSSEELDDYWSKNVKRRIIYQFPGGSIE